MLLFMLTVLFVNKKLFINSQSFIRFVNKNNNKLYLLVFIRYNK